MIWNENRQDSWWRDLSRNIQRKEHKKNICMLCFELTCIFLLYNYRYVMYSLPGVIQKLPVRSPICRTLQKPHISCIMNKVSSEPLSSDLSASQFESSQIPLLRIIQLFHRRQFTCAWSHKCHMKKSTSSKGIAHLSALQKWQFTTANWRTFTRNWQFMYVLVTRSTPKQYFEHLIWLAHCPCRTLFFREEELYWCLWVPQVHSCLESGLDVKLCGRKLPLGLCKWES